MSRRPRNKSHSLMLNICLHLPTIRAAPQTPPDLSPPPSSPDIRVSLHPRPFERRSGCEYLQKHTPFFKGFSSTGCINKQSARADTRKQRLLRDIGFSTYSTLYQACGPVLHYVAGMYGDLNSSPKSEAVCHRAMQYLLGFIRFYQVVGGGCQTRYEYVSLE